MCLARCRTNGRARSATRAAFVLALALAAFARADAAASRVRGESADAAAPAEFRSELVRLAIDGDSLTVDGLYRFRLAPSRAGVPIFYPFPLDPRLGDAHMLSLDVRAAAGAWRPLAWRDVPASSGVSWLMPADLGEAIEVRAVYRQRLHGRWARYIVTTTSSWGRPLDRARFELTLPEGTRPREASVAFRAATRDGRRVWVHDAKRFAPTCDIDVAW